MKKSFYALLFCGILAAAVGGGARECAAKTMKIESAEDLAEFRDLVNEGETDLDAELKEDIDLASVCGTGLGSWVPISSYNGNFDGAGHTVSNLYVAVGPEEKAGLFGKVESGSTIQNLVLENAAVDGGEYTGAVAAYAEGTISNCSVSGNIKGYEKVGGIVGTIGHGTSEGSAGEGLTDCVNSAVITCEEDIEDACVGGIAGYTSQNIRNCENNGEIHSFAKYTGGIAGRVEGTYYDEQGYFAKIENCRNNGPVSGYVFVGGIAGSLYDGYLNNCINAAEIKGYTYLGGLCGSMGGKAEKGEYTSIAVNSVNTGNVEMYPLESNDSIVCRDNSYDYYSEQFGAGIAAYAYSSVILNCRNTGDILCSTRKYIANCGAAYISEYLGGSPTLVLNCISTAKITKPETEDERFMENGVVVTGASYNAASVFYVGEPCSDDIEPVSEAGLTDGSILTELNTFPENIPEELMGTLKESGISYEVCKWKQGENAPVLEWEN